MKIIACVKVVPDEQDININADGTLLFERAKPTISSYDLNAVETAAQLVESNGGTVAIVSVGNKKIDNAKLKKDILSRGADELYLVADDKFESLDTHQTAKALKEAVEKIGEYDLILCGEGSADLYAQQAGIQLGQMLELPTCNKISKVSVNDGVLLVERFLEDEVETLEISLPAVISVTSDINLPRIPGMKEILAAGKKPTTIWGADDVLSTVNESTVDTLETKAPKQVERKQDIVQGDSDEEIATFIAKVREAIG